MPFKFKRSGNVSDSPKANSSTSTLHSDTAHPVAIVHKHAIGSSDNLNHSEKAQSSTQPAPLASSNGDAEKGASSNGDVPTDETQYLTGAKLYLVLGSLILIMILVSLDQTIVAAAIPAISNDFNALSDVGWYGSAYLLTGTAFQPVLGKAFTYFSLKWTYIACTVVFLVGSLICGVAQDSTTFIVGRAIAGVGFGGLYVGVLAIASAIVPVERQAAVISFLSAWYGVGCTIGPIIGGSFTTKVTWRWCFYINLPIGGVALVLAVLFLNPPPRKQEMSAFDRLRRLDFLGTCILIGSVICLLLALQDGGVKRSWSSSVVIGELVGFVLLLASYAGIQYWLGENASIVPRVLKNRNIAMLAVTNMSVGTAYFTLLYFVPFYFQAVRGSSAIRSSVQTLPLIVLLIVCIILAGGIADKKGTFNGQLLMGTALASIGCGLLTTLKVDSSTGIWVGFQILAGVGIGLSAMMPYIGSQIVTQDPKDRPAAGVIAIFAQTLAAAIMLSSCQAIYQNKLLEGIKQIPGIDVKLVIDSGVSAFREILPPEFVPLVAEKAVWALSKVFLVGAVFAAFGFVTASTVQWIRLQPGDKVSAGAA
ncbi:hypothetical protein OIV83_002323 [Microbotryomycetes sp. JL201]|nr:hypothetical protein OIV83_002323 [Microbotryomycetes sp. JL201]